MSWGAMGASALEQLLCRTEVKKLSKVFLGEGCVGYRRYHCSERLCTNIPLAFYILRPLSSVITY